MTKYGTIDKRKLNEDVNLLKNFSLTVDPETKGWDLTIGSQADDRDRPCNLPKRQK